MWKDMRSICEQRASERRKWNIQTIAAVLYRADAFKVWLRKYEIFIKFKFILLMNIFMMICLTTTWLSLDYFMTFYSNSILNQRKCFWSSCCNKWNGTASKCSAHCAALYSIFSSRIVVWTHSSVKWNNSFDPIQMIQNHTIPSQSSRKSTETNFETKQTFLMTYTSHKLRKCWCISLRITLPVIKLVDLWNSLNQFNIKITLCYVRFQQN